MMKRLLVLFSAAVLGACSGDASSQESPTGEVGMTLPSSAKSLVVAGGCFWCVEKDFEARDDVFEAVSGYSGGTKRDATYQNHEGHREVVEVFYDSEKTDYATLVRFFLRTIDVTDDGGQFCDRGFSYTTAIHYRTDEERIAAEAAVAEAEAALGQDVVTPVVPFDFFVTAEDYHQDYYKKNPVRYRLYRGGCGRDGRVKAVWGAEAAIK